MLRRTARLSGCGGLAARWLALAALAWPGGCTAAGDGRPGDRPGTQGGNGGQGGADPGDASFDNADAAAAPGRDARPEEPTTDGGCAWLSLDSERVVPTVQLVIDRSMSMGSAFAGAPDTTYNVLHDTLFDPDGVVTLAQREVRFGALFYWADSACPELSEVAPRLVNQAPLETRFSSLTPGGTTPSAEALAHAAAGLPDPVPLDAPHVVVLATDGMPTSCELPDTDSAGIQLRLEAQAAAIQARGATLRVLLLAPATPQQRGQLERVANLGVGRPADALPAEPIFVSTDPASLRDDLTALVGDARSCLLSLHGELEVDEACRGEVRLQDELLACEGDNGWRAVDASHIELLGAACELWKAERQSELAARFPCGVARVD